MTSKRVRCRPVLCPWLQLSPELGLTYKPQTNKLHVRQSKAHNVNQTRMEIWKLLWSHSRVAPTLISHYQAWLVYACIRSCNAGPVGGWTRTMRGTYPAPWEPGPWRDGCGLTALFEHSLHLWETEEAEATLLRSWKRKSQLYTFSRAKKRAQQMGKRKLKKRAVLLEFLGRKSGLTVCWEASFFHD